MGNSANRHNRFIDLSWTSLWGQLNWEAFKRSLSATLVTVMCTLIICWRYFLMHLSINDVYIPFATYIVFDIRNSSREWDGKAVSTWDALCIPSEKNRPKNKHKSYVNSQLKLASTSIFVTLFLRHLSHSLSFSSPRTTFHSSAALAGALVVMKHFSFSIIYSYFNIFFFIIAVYFLSLSLTLDIPQPNTVYRKYLRMKCEKFLLLLAQKKFVLIEH